jgi:hypothetical protein
MVNKYVLVGAAVAGLCLAYMVKKAAGAAIDKGKQLAIDAGQAINPLNNQNIINRGVTGFYQGVTGSDGSMGTDAFDAVQAVVKKVDDYNAAAARARDDSEPYGWAI